MAKVSGLFLSEVRGKSLPLGSIYLLHITMRSFWMWIRAYISGVMMIPPTIYLAVRMVRVRRRRMPGFQVIQSDKSGKS